MKKNLLISLLFCLVSLSQAQSRGWIGIDIGYGLLSSEKIISTNIVTYDYLNAGYTFDYKSGLGLALRCTGGASTVQDIIDDDGNYNLKGLYFGPMFSFNPARNLYLDTKIMVGISTLMQGIGNEKESETSQALNLGINLRYNFHKRWNFSYSVDRQAMEISGCNLNCITMSYGIGVRI